MVGLVPDRPHVHDIAVASADRGHEASEARRAGIGDVIGSTPCRPSRHRTGHRQEDPQPTSPRLGQQAVVAHERGIARWIALVEARDAARLRRRRDRLPVQDDAQPPDAEGRDLIQRSRAQRGVVGQQLARSLEDRDLRAPGLRGGRHEHGARKREQRQEAGRARSAAPSRHGHVSCHRRHVTRAGLTGFAAASNGVSAMTSGQRCDDSGLALRSCDNDPAFPGIASCPPSVSCA